MPISNSSEKNAEAFQCGVDCHGPTRPSCRASVTALAALAAAQGRWWPPSYAKPAQEKYRSPFVKHRPSPAEARTYRLTLTDGLTSTE